ncbi:MAG TPA: ABC transporter permease [Thermoanaerobaculia bacterium]|nr:ABC transporter permease [Thermoanaerobaculia bacterium]
MSAILRDLRYALRALRARPGFTLAAILTLALGIGANSAIFSFVEALLLRPLPYRAPESLVWIADFIPGFNAEMTSGADYLDWQEQSRLLSQVGAFDRLSFTLQGREQPERLQGTRVSPDLLPMLGIKPAKGRGFRPEEAKLHGSPAAIVSARLWERLFGVSAVPSGQLLRLDGQAYPVVGVLPRHFVFPGSPDIDLLVPLQLNTAVEHGRQQLSILSVVGRLRPGATLEQARKELQAISDRAAAAAQAAPALSPGGPALAPGPRRGSGMQFRTLGGPGGPGARRMSLDSQVRMVGLHEELVGKVRPALLLLAGAVGLVLLIACVNVAHLLLARAAARRREIAVRAALGASQRQIVRHLLIESVLLGLAGGASGLLIALWGARLLAALTPPDLAGSLLPQIGVGVNGPVLLFTFVLSLATSLLFGLVPALSAARVDLREPLQATAASGLGRGRGFLVAGEVALASVLLVGAGLLLRSFARIQSINPGFRPERVLTLAIDLSPSGGYDSPAAQAAFFSELAQRVEALPGVKSTAFGDSLPLSRVSRIFRGLRIENRPPRDPREQPEVMLSAVSPGYFRTLGTTLLRGRAFDARDASAAAPVAIVNRTLAHSFWGDEDPIDKRLSIGGQPWVTVVGMAADVHREGLTAAPKAELYRPFLQSPDPYGFLAVRTAGDPALLTAAARREVRSLNAELPVFDVSTLEDRLAATVAARRFGLLLLSTFAVLSLGLAALGLAGVIAYAVTERTREIGIRMALGARRGDVLSMVLSQGLVMAAAGVAVGLPVAFGLSRLLGSALYGIAPSDPITYLAIPLVLLTVALVAAYLPARRATRVDPVVALRQE